MAIALAVTGVAFAAFCVWLTVRIVNRRERWAKWLLASLLFGFPLLYVASFGPACWLLGRSTSRFAVADAYAPLVMLSKRGTVLHWFATLCTDDNALVLMRASLENRHNGGHGYPTWLPFAFQLEQIQQ